MVDQATRGGEVRDWVVRYRPLRVSSLAWSAIGSEVREVVIEASPTVAAARKLLPHATAFGIWSRLEGATSVHAALADSDWIERYIAVGMPGSADSTRATRRAALRRIARRVAPTVEPPPEPISYRTLKPPYQSWQVSRFLELANLQPTPSRRRNLGAVLVLGLGAGLDGRDLAWVRGVDMRRCAGHLVVAVRGGSRRRELVVLDQYAERVERFAAEVGEGLLIGGRVLGRHNVTSVSLGRMVGDRTLPTLLASRLRSTWLTTHLNLCTPLSVLLPAAGLKTARPLGDLLPYVDAVATNRAAAYLGGVG